MSAAGTTNTSRVGGAGGKALKKPFRRHLATPYDRPPTAPRSTPLGNGWLSRLVDPASKLISAGAHKLFASVFRKRLLPPPPPAPQKQHSPDGDVDRTESEEDNLGAKEQAVHDLRSFKVSNESNGIAELEKILMEKNFTRSEMDHLTALLQSKATSMPSDVGTERTKATPEKNHGNHSRDMEVINGPVFENGLNSSVVSAATSTPVFRKNAVEESMASPVDLAKAYMANRSTSMTGLQSQARKEDPPFSASSFQLRSPSITLASKPYNPANTYENAIVVPRSRGKSAIYSMPCPPYSKAQPSLTFKGSGAAFAAGPSSPSLFQSALENSQSNDPKKSVLKRRSSVLDNDIGSIGPIRRIRQKPNLQSPRSIAVPLSETSHVARGCETGAAGKGHSTLNSSAERVDGKLDNVSAMQHPSRSVEMGQKILQQLEKLSPKQKSRARVLKIADGKSPSELTADMLHGQARRSLETVDSLKFIQRIQINNDKTGALDAMQDIPNSTHKKEDNINDSDPKGPGIPFDTKPPASSAESGLSIKVSFNAPVRKIDDPPKKRGAFQMSAHEEYVEVEEDVHSNGDMSGSLSERKKDDFLKSVVPTGEKKDANIVNHPPSDDVISLKKMPLFSETKSSPVSVAYKTKELEPATVATSVVKTKNDFIFPSSPVPAPVFSITGNPAVPFPTSESSSEVASPQLNTVDPAFSLPHKSSDIVSPLSFSPPSFPTNSSGSKDVKSELSGSFSAGISTSIAAPTFPEPSKIDDKGQEDAVNLSRKEETVPSSSVIGVASGAFSFNVPISGSIMSNGVIGSGSEAASAFSPVLFSHNSTKQGFSNGFTQSTSTVDATTVASVAASSATDATKEASPIVTASSSGLSTKSSTPPISIFKFGASELPAASDSWVSTSFGSESSESGLKPKETVFGNQSSPFSVPSSVTANADTGFFGFKTSVSSKGSPFASSTAAFNPFASAPAFGSNSSGSSSTTASLSNTSMSSSSVSSGTLGSSWQSSSPSVFNTTFNSSSAPIFSFGATGSTSVSAATTVPMVFGATSLSSSPAFSLPASTQASWNPVSLSQSSVGSTSSAFTFGLTSSNTNNDQMNMEDSMAEDSVQASAPAVPTFSRSPIATPPSTGFLFGAAPSPATNPFQFGSQPSHQVAAQNLSVFQPSGSFESNPGSFSLGAGGNDKSARKIIKVRRKR